MIFKTKAGLSASTDKVIYFIRANDKKHAAERFAITGLKIYEITEATGAEIVEAEKNQRILFECETEVKHIFDANGREGLYLTAAEEKTLRKARNICLSIYEEVKRNEELEQAADDIQDRIEYLLKTAEASAEGVSE